MIFNFYSADALCILISHGTSWIAEIIHWIISPNLRTHLRKVFLKILSSIAETEVSAFLDTKQLSEEVSHTHSEEANNQVTDHGLLGWGFS